MHHYGDMPKIKWKHKVEEHQVKHLSVCMFM